MFSRLTLAVVLTAAIALPTSASPAPASFPKLTAEQWRADIDYVARELPKRHKNAFHHVTREQFTAAVAALRERAASASDAAMFIGLMQLTAMVGDGHTRVNLRPGMLHGFPIGVAEIEGAFRIVRGAGPAAELVGARLTKIDGMPLADVIARVRTIISQDESEVLLQARTPQWFSVAEALYGLGIIREPDAAQYTAVLDDGTERTVSLRALDASSKPEWRLAAASQPLYRQRPGESFWYEWLADSATVYVSFRSYEDLKAKSRELWSFVDAHPVRKIAFDIRQNGGGDFTVGRRYLVDELARRPKIHGYVITGATSFSAALKTAIDFREVAHATLAGETIGEKPNSYAENDEMTLPNSKLEISYSTRYYQFLPGDDGLVKPDKEILPTWADWVAGRDPVLDWILQDAKGRG